MNEGLGPLLQQHRGSVYRCCLARVRSRCRAEELTQDTLVVALRRYDRLYAVGSLRAWLLGIARRLCVNDRRKRRELLSAQGEVALVDPGDVLEGLLGDERRRLLWAEAERRLLPLERRALYLRCVEEVPDKQIEALLGLTNPSGARGVLFGCRRKLERALLA
jgi:RNA polymerase sigma factor (sigma-70 family)